MPERRGVTLGALGVLATLGLGPAPPGGASSASHSVSIGAPLGRGGDAPVADAAMRRDVAALRRLLQQGADVNAAQADGMTALHWAAANDDEILIRVLVSAGGRLESATRNGAYTPLHLASKSGAARGVAALLAAGANPTARTSSGGATALHFAAGHGSRAAVAALLVKGAPVDARDSAWSQTPLMWAAAAGRLEAMAALIARGADLRATSRVEDVPAREKAERTSAQARAKKMAALRAAAAAMRPADSGRARADSGSRSPADSGRTAADSAAKAKADSTAKVTADSVRRVRVADSIKAAGEPKPLSYGELIGKKGGLTPLLFAAREGHTEAATALLAAGADVNQPSEGDRTSPLLMAVLNGHFDLAMALLDRGADPKLASEAGATPLYATLNIQWSAKSLYPQPTSHHRQTTDYLTLMTALLDKGADPNPRLAKHLWYASFNFDLLGVNTAGATPFWRAAYGTDVQAMKLLVARGADPSLPTLKPAGRQRGEGGDDEEKKSDQDPSGLPPAPVGGPGTYPIHAASGVGYGEGFAANAHRHVPEGWMPAIKYLVEVLKVDVNARDYNGYNAIHHAAARGDNEMINYLVSKGADVTAVSRKGQTTADMANGPVQRVPPFLKTVALLEKLGSKNSHKCKSC
ncbi:MAG: ankyrin repeat domain-containing protein [Gemmatimonadales bacterium]